MAYVELSSEDEALLEEARKLAGNGGAQQLNLHARAFNLHNMLLADNDITDTYQDQIKKVAPTSRVPKDVAAPYARKLDEGLKKIDDFMSEQQKRVKEQSESERQSSFDKSWNNVVKDYDLTDEGQEKLLSMMKDRGLADPEAAAALYFRQNPIGPAPVTPQSVAPQTWGLGAMSVEGDDKATKLLMDNPDAWADQEAAATLNEIRKQAA